MPETLRQKQSRFARMIAQLINHATILGLDVTLGDCYRAKTCSHGHKSSLHRNRLAVDLNLFRNGRYLSSTKAHTPLGEYWESIGGTWGGRFKDGNHYSLAHGGRK